MKDAINDNIKINITSDQLYAFKKLCSEVLTSARSDSGIGTLREKKLHAIIKKYVSPDERFHEIRVVDTIDGLSDEEKKKGQKYIADVLIDKEIYEVQTGSLYPLLQKVKWYIENTDCHITVIHPIASKKYISWINPDTHEISPRKLSPKKVKLYDMADEFYPFRELLMSNRVGFRIMQLEIEEYRILDGYGKSRKLRSTKYERLPSKLYDEVDFFIPEDFLFFLPDDIPEVFTAKIYSSITKIKGITAYSAIKILLSLGFIEENGRSGRSQTYKRTQIAKDI